MKVLSIALDFDGTFTADPLFWYDFIVDAQAAGHLVRVVTYRNAQHDRHAAMDFLENDLNVHTVFTDGTAKKKYCSDHNIHIDIWIDDRPETITQSMGLNPVELAKWREQNETA